MSDLSSRVQSFRPPDHPHKDTHRYHQHLVTLQAFAMSKYTLKCTNTGGLVIACVFLAKCLANKHCLKKDKHYPGNIAGEKPFKCDVCGRTFARSDEKKRHAKVKIIK